MYPRIKKVEEFLEYDPDFTKLDLQELIKKGEDDKIMSIIQRIDEETDQRSIHIVASVVYDHSLLMMRLLDH